MQRFVKIFIQLPNKKGNTLFATVKASVTQNINPPYTEYNTWFDVDKRMIDSEIAKWEKEPYHRALNIMRRNYMISAKHEAYVMHTLWMRIRNSAMYGNITKIMFAWK